MSLYKVVVNKKSKLIEIYDEKMELMFTVDNSSDEYIICTATGAPVSDTTFGKLSDALAAVEQLDQKDENRNGLKL